LVEWGWSAAAKLLTGNEDGASGLSPATRDRVIDLIEGDLDCLVEDAREKPIPERSVEEMLRNRELLIWLKGGPIAGAGAVELLQENVAVFYRVSDSVEQANGDALRATLDELVRAQSTAYTAGSFGSRAEPTELTERERRRFGTRLDELRADRDLTVGELSSRSEIDVVSIVALIHGAQEAGSIELMRLAAALEVLPRDLFPECLAGGDAEPDHEGAGGEEAK